MSRIFKDGYKELYGNTAYAISISKKSMMNIASRKITDLTSVGDIEITWYNKRVVISARKLMLVAFFEYHLKDLSIVSFVDERDWFYSNAPKKVMVFNRRSEPEFKRGFRYIPNYIHHAVNEAGTEVVNVHTGKRVHITTSDKVVYSKVSIRDPTRSTIENVKLHRMVAFAWVRNDNYQTDFIVNHISSNKKQCEASNLEWVSNSGNMHHAYKAGSFKHKRSRAIDI